MTADQVERPFDSIESAYEFMNLLSEAILEAMKDLHQDRQMAMDGGMERRTRAIDLALFKTRALNLYVSKCRRALNDLRTIRRLILNERLPAGLTGGSGHGGVERASHYATAAADSSQDVAG